MSQKPVYVATHPRACSTAFERVFMTRRNSLHTIHEPFGDAFYFGPERMSSRFEEDDEGRNSSGFSNSTFKTILDRIDQEGAEAGKRVFIKDILHYLIPPNQQAPEIAPSLRQIPKRGVGTSTPETNYAGTESPVRTLPFPYHTYAEPKNPSVVPKEVLEKFHFTFLIRHPRSAVPSYYRCCVPPLVEKTGFYDFMPSEAGYDELRRFFDYLKDVGLIGPKVCGRVDSPRYTGEAESDIEICVIDADDLLDDPEGVLSQYCASIGVDFDKDTMLNWSEADQEFARKEFEKWNGFHDDAIHSTDLKPRQHKRKPKSDDELFNEWTEKFGEDAAKVIRKTVNDNVADYEYLKQFAIQI
ncbi:hypothetical protein K431DRAFT_228130 [Polychaeton citri CBS 116435]|uniref:P-loop containing nucleoside triphosphate hydrolase protein n=1 Tax=Polychaeton citri CBS 116435 TaxID=1314669 RepID=A0A9P4Q5H3_9PEZI|nr:hypothetical protein K431DRAFT_228130 [Polychaeton citri CBS 116435]